MDWARAVEINLAALMRIVTALVALLPQPGKPMAVPVYQLLTHMVHPAESAVRRLIVIAARGLVVSLRPSRPMPKGLVIKGQGRRMVFPLFDPRKNFTDVDTIAPEAGGPRILSVGEASPRSRFLAQFPKTDAAVSAARSLRISQRLLTIKHALDTLPRQARRMAQWIKRREMMTDPKFLSPLRPGRAPGHVKRSREEIHLVLYECHALARDALVADTS